MLRPARNYGRLFFAPLGTSACLNARPTLPLTQTRTAWGTPAPKSPGRTKKRKYYYTPETPLAEELHATGVWRNVDKRTAKPKGGKKSKSVIGDKSRINITSEPLVEDIIDYLGPTLERHKGCDLISLYPGAGLWSKALHERLQPRSHLLLEPDEELYKPWLEPLLKQDGVRLIPKSGIIWKELDQILTPEYLPHQKEISRDPNTPTPRNDTLLVTLNLSMYPKKSYQLFESLSRLVLYQLINSMRHATLFQKYGRVRMLAWVPEDEKNSVVPRTLHARKRLAIEGELFSEYIAEVCGPDGTFIAEENGWSSVPDSSAKAARRWGQFDLESVRMAMVRMRDSGIRTPEGRETRLMKMFHEDGRDLETSVPLTEYIVTQSKKAQKEFDEMAAVHAVTPYEKNTPEYARYSMLRAYLIWRDKNEKISWNKFVAYHNVREAYIAASQATTDSKREELLQKAKEMEEAFDKEIERTAKYIQILVTLGRDQGRMLYHQPPEMGPVLSWDRRPYEPLPVKPQDFFPNIPCALIDIQPGVVPAAVRAIGPGTNNSGSIFDLILGVLLQRPTLPVAGQLDILWPGADADVGQNLKTLTDPSLGGTPLTGQGAMSCRAINKVQMMELLDSFMAWEFRPSYKDLLGRLAEDRFGEADSDEDDDGPSGSHGSPDSL